MAVQKPLSAFVELCWWPLVIFVYYLFTFSIFFDVSPGVVCWCPSSLRSSLVLDEIVGKVRGFVSPTICLLGVFVT